MAKAVHDTVLDAALNTIKNASGANMSVCSAQPTTVTEASSTYKLADIGMTSGDYTGPADGDGGDGSGRKLTTVAKNGVLVDANGTATHVAIYDATNVLYVTTCTSQGLTSGNNVNIPAWKVQIADPT